MSRLLHYTTGLPIDGNILHLVQMSSIPSWRGLQCWATSPVLFSFCPQDTCTSPPSSFLLPGWQLGVLLFLWWSITSSVPLLLIVVAPCDKSSSVLKWKPHVSHWKWFTAIMHANRVITSIWSNNENRTFDLFRSKSLTCCESGQ